MERVASTRHTTTKYGVFSITTADTHNTAASSPLNWRPRQFKWTRSFRRKTKSGSCACAITFQTQSTVTLYHQISNALYLCQHTVNWHAWPSGNHDCCYWWLSQTSNYI